MSPILSPQRFDSTRRQKAPGVRATSLGTLGLLFILFGCSSCVSEPSSHSSLRKSRGSVRDNLGNALYFLYKPKLVRVKSSGPDAEKYLCHYGSGSEHFELRLYRSRQASGLFFRVYFKPEGPNIYGRDDKLSRVGWWSGKGIQGLYVARRGRGWKSVSLGRLRVKSQSSSSWYYVSIHLDNRGRFAFAVYPDEDRKITVSEYDFDLNRRKITSREITFDEFRRKYADVAKGRDRDLFPSAANIELLLEELAHNESDRLWDYAYRLMKKKIPNLPPLE